MDIYTPGWRGCDMAGELRLLLEKGPLEPPVQELCAPGDAAPDAAARLALHCFFNSCMHQPLPASGHGLLECRTQAFTFHCGCLNAGHCVASTCYLGVQMVQSGSISLRESSCQQVCVGAYSQAEWEYEHTHGQLDSDLCTTCHCSSNAMQGRV